MQSFVTIISFILILGGLISIIFPIAPSIPTIWFGIFIYSISHHFISINNQFMLLITLIGLLTILLDYSLSRGGTKKLRADSWGIIGALLGGALGSFFDPIGTFLVGPILGAIIAELIRGRDNVYSYSSGNTTVVAFMGGTIVKLIAALAMIGLFILRLQHRI